MIYRIDHFLTQTVQWLGGTEGSVWNKITDVFFAACTFMCEEMFILALVFVFYWALNKKTAQYMLLSMFGAVSVNGLVKSCVMRYRPFLNPDFADLRYVRMDNVFVDTVHLENSFSFPSGHSQTTGAMFPTLGLLSGRKKYLILSFVLVVLVMMSRVYLGVHYPTDTIVGAALGIGTAFLVVKVLNRDYSKRFMLYFICLGILAATLILEIILYSVGKDINSLPDTAKMLGTAAGGIVGLLIEEKYIKFDVGGAWWKRVLRVVIGFAVVMGIRLGVKALFDAAMPEQGIAAECVFGAIRYAMIGVFAAAGWPAIFKKIKL